MSASEWGTANSTLTDPTSTAGASEWGTANSTLENPPQEGASSWGTANVTLGEGAPTRLRGAIVGGQLVDIAVRGVIQAGDLVAANLRGAIVNGALNGAEPPPPADTGVLVGIWNGPTNGNDDVFYNALGSSLTCATSYLVKSDQVNGVWQMHPRDVTRISRGIAPCFHIQSVSWNYDILDHVQWWPWARIADGTYDSMLTEFATNVLANAPVGSSFSFDCEPEVRLEVDSHLAVPNPNSPDDWPAGWPQNGDGLNTPESFAAALQRIYTVMKPIAPHINFRWWIAGHLRNSYMETFYPGDAYVDSIGIDPYVWSYNSSSTTPYQKYEPIVTWLRSRTWGQGKPIGISETGFDTTHGDAAQAAFWNAMPAAVDALQLKHLVFYNRSNWTISQATHPLAWAAYVNAMHTISAM